MKKKSDKVKIYKANLLLQQKIGTGLLDKKTIAQAQKIIEENDVDFVPLGLQFLKELEEALDHAEGNLNPRKNHQKKEFLTDPVMELKANAAIFHYPLVGNLANIMLSFLESIDNLDKDALEIVRTHHDTLKTIISKKMTGDGGADGQVFILELKDACARYYKKTRQGQKPDTRS